MLWSALRSDAEEPEGGRVNRLSRVSACAAAVVLAMLAGTATRPGDGLAQAAAAPPEFVFSPARGIGNFDGFGVQLNQHVYADLSGPPQNLAALEREVVAFRAPLVRVFFNTTEWTFPDRMASFERTVALAHRSGSHINITWQGSGVPFALANMDRFADVLVERITALGIGELWVTLFNEPNSTRITLAQYEHVYRLLDAELRARNVRDHVHFMGGDLLGTTSPLGQSQAQWFTYMADRMGDLLDAWSVHVYWDFWDAGKIDRRLQAEVRTIFAAIPAEKRRPLFVTEFGVRGVPTFEGEEGTQPGSWPDGTGMSQTTLSAFQHAWLMLRAAQLGFNGTIKWDLYAAKYDAGSQDHSALGPGAQGWPARPVYRLLQLLTTTTEPRGGRIVDVVPAAGTSPSKVLTGYVSPAGDVTVLGLDNGGGIVATTSSELVPYTIGGLPPGTSFRFLVWNGDGTGQVREVGRLATDATGTVHVSVPRYAVFALTTTPPTP
jgi:hypothetical protein